jgi:hypothetical protein
MCGQGIGFFQNCPLRPQFITHPYPRRISKILFAHSSLFYLVLRARIFEFKGCAIALVLVTPFKKGGRRQLFHISC